MFEVMMVGASVTLYTLWRIIFISTKLVSRHILMFISI
jgi:hypothetical protein